MIQKLLGHASIKTTEVYLRSLNIDDSIEKAVKHSPLQTIK
jgi:integrase/recombinase XerD